MTDQVVWSGETRTEVSKLVVATNELTSKVITLLNAISGNFDGLVEQLEEATSAVNGGVADLSIIKADIEGSIRRAQEDMGNIYQSFLAESSDIKSSLSGLSTEADDLQLIMTTLNNTGTMLADKYNLLNATAAEVGNSVLLYKNQAGAIQESILSVESRAATISANLDRISEMAQVNTESSEEFMKEIANMQIEVYQLSSSVMEYKELADSLVENYTNLKQVAAEAQTMATAAHNDAVNATDKITAIADQYGDLSGTVESIKTLISEYNSIAADITSQLSSSSGELTAMRSTINDFSDFISSTISTVETNIATLISKVSSLTIKVDDLTSKIDSASETIYSIKSMVDVQLQDAVKVISDATNTASYIEGVVASNKTTVEDCLAILGVAKTDTDLVFDNMTAYKAEVSQLYSDTMGHLTTVETNLAVLDTKAATVTEQLNSALDTLTGISEHVDTVNAHVDEVAGYMDTTFLKKVDQAADSVLLAGKGVDYFLHDDNREDKLSTSTTITQIKTDISNINDLIKSDTGSLDTLQEIVDFIKLNKESLDNLTISNIAGLQTALDGKLAVGANAVSASKWETARKITLGGALAGFVDIDGASDVTLNATIVSINDVPGLVDAMSNKLDKNAVAADSSKLGGIEAARFFFGDTAANVKVIAAADIDGLTQSGFYRVTDSNQSVVYIHGDADSAVRITYDYSTSHLYYKEKLGGVWSATNFKVLSDASRLDFTKLDNVPVFATRANTWDEVTGKPTEYTPSAHGHLWDEISGKPTSYTPSVHSHYWDDILGKPTTFLASPHNHYSVISEGLLTEINGTESITYMGVSMVEAKSSNKYVTGTKEGTVLNLKGDAQAQLMVSHNASTGSTVLVRSKGYDAESTWSEWAKLFSNQDSPAWSDIVNKPTTLAGYGITDGALATHEHAFADLTSKPTTLAGYGITDGALATHGHAFADLTSKPTTLAGYGITDAAPAGYGLGGYSVVSRGSLNLIHANGWQDYNGDGGDTDGPATYGNVFHITSSNASGLAGWAGQLFLNTSGTLYVRTNVAAAGTFAGSAWNKIYSTHDKPTPAEIGAMSDGGRYSTVTFSNWVRTTGATGWYNSTYAGGIHMTDTTWVRTYNGTKFQVANTSADAIYTLGGILAAGDIVAYYSDRRLKKNLVPVTGALDKISSLTAYNYNANELANKLAGYDTEKLELGLIAQDVQKVAPEVVTLAGFDTESDKEGHYWSKSGENYLTIKYERLVPLLVEAIKELKEEVECLRLQVKSL